MSHRLVVLGVLSLGLMQCAHTGPVASGWSSECGPPIEGLEPLIAPGHTLVLGEIHGTREVADFAYAAACQAAQAGPVVLGLEFPPQPQFEAFLSSDGSPAARRALLAAPFWTADFQDGRESAAALGLLERVRALRQRGRPIELLLFDAQPEDVSQRDRLMAQNVIDFHAAHPRHTAVLVMGNLHARKKAGVPWDPTYQWLASLLTWPVVSLDAVHEDGTAWVCVGNGPEGCGPKVVAGRNGLGRRAVKLAPSPDGYDGVFDVGHFTASPPAAFPEKAAGFEARLAELVKGPEMLEAKGRSLAMQGDFVGCARKLGEVSEPSAGLLYDRACCLSQAGEIDEAFAALSRALAAGFDDLRTLEADADLEALRRDPRWAGLKPRK